VQLITVITDEQLQRKRDDDCQRCACAG